MDLGFKLLGEAAEQLQAGLPQWPAAADPPELTRILQDVATRLQDNYPYHHPLYAGQMLKPPHPVARLSYALAQLLNPNNHALDGGRASSQMEKEAVAQLAAMWGWRDCLGHLTSGGTIANLEALWVAGQTHPGKTILGSSQAHYTHSRISGVLQLPFETVAADAQGRMDLAQLQERLAHNDVGTVVVTLGTTAMGAVDPLHEILPLARSAGARVHVDAAYGGYFGLSSVLEPSARAAFDAVSQADSLAIDPHKHGLQPYGCGCILFRDPQVGRLYKHDSPYTYFSSAELHLGEISLECSRAGASAVALWATQRLLPLVRGGEFAAGLDKGIQAARELYGRLAADDRWRTWLAPELDIVVWSPAGSRASEVSRRSQEVFDRAAELGLHLALTQVSPAQGSSDLKWDTPTVTCLRSCLIKPEHLEWLPQIWELLNRSL
jgi:tyrosine decarboxylase / aspartate 1-decarboxylase